MGKSTASPQKYHHFGSFCVEIPNCHQQQDPKQHRLCSSIWNHSRNVNCKITCWKTHSDYQVYIQIYAIELVCHSYRIHIYTQYQTFQYYIYVLCNKTYKLYYTKFNLDIVIPGFQHWRSDIISCSSVASLSYLWNISWTWILPFWFLGKQDTSMHYP